MLKVLLGSCVSADRRLVNHPCVGSPLSFSLVFEAFHQSQWEHVQSWGVEFLIHRHGCMLLQTHTHSHCTVIHQGAAHSHPIENVLFAVEPHTNSSHFVLGGGALARVPNPSPLILTLFSEREKREAAARRSSLVISRWGYLQSYIGAATELRLSRSRQSKDSHRRQIWDGLITQRREGAACQDENINGTQPERDAERDGLHVKFIV